MLTIAYVFFALQFLAAASPHPSLDARIQRIGLTRRQPLNNTGVADITRLTNQIASTLVKHDNGFTAYKSNTGQEHPLVASNSTVSRRDVQSEPLTDDSNSLWLGNLCIGTPLQSYTVGVDTGSASLLVVASSCTSADCQSHTLYDPSASTSSVNRNKAFTIRVTDSENVSGNQYADIISLAGLEATGQALGAASSYPQSFNSLATPPDGRMGMAYGTISALQSTSVPQSLAAQGVLTQRVFALKLTPTNGELTLGGTDTAAYTGQITYTPVTTRAFWQIIVQSMQASSSSRSRPVGPLQAIVDSGSQLVVTDLANAIRLYATIPGSQRIRGGGSSSISLFTVPCNNIPTVSFTIRGQSFSIPPAVFNQGPVSQGSSQCVGGIAGGPAKMRYTILGNVFLQNFYSVFDLGNNRVGFAALAP